MDIIKILAQEFSINPVYVENVINLIDQGNTIPFIARYRKEQTNSLDDQVLRKLADRLEYLRNLEARKEEVFTLIEQGGHMTEELAAAIQNAKTLAELDDIYRPYRPKRRTRATIARERGLAPLAEIIMAQDVTDQTLEKLAEPYINPDLEVNTTEEALAGACDILAEDISDNAAVRKILKELFWREALIVSTGDPETESVYQLYYEFSEPISKVANHRILAINRGEKEDFLKAGIELDENLAVFTVRNNFVIMGSVTTPLVMDTCQDAYKRLIQPSIEREIRNELTDRASEQAIEMFSLNLKNLLMQPPIAGKNVLALDPAYRTGCKIAVVDATGKLLHTTVVYPTPPQSKVLEAERELTALIKKHKVTAISIGNGTASKESEIFIAQLIAKLDSPVQYMMVNEAGASVYSASKLAATEFPELDVSHRSAVSIARRMQDPLAELVKINPKSIGVGQYQHDMPQNRLDGSLGGVVESCVNAVGVNLNTASAPLLSYVSGLSSAVAANIVTYREDNGMFSSSAQLKKVPKLGPKAFEQSAGFLRIPQSKNILDNTGVHPESYPAAERLLQILGFSLEQVKNGEISTLGEKAQAYGRAKLAQELEIGEFTLNDIIKELLKPGLDPRDDLPPPMLRSDILDMKDLTAGMKLTGTVRNVIDFGAFVDIGVHQDGLVHISEITNKYIKHPSEVLKVGDIVNVTVLSVDQQKKRISLTMKDLAKR